MKRAHFNAGVIGLGVGHQHLVGFDQLVHCQRLAACDLEAEKLNRVRDQFPHVRCTTRWQDLVEDPTIHVVSIASFDDAHYDQVMALLAAGKHVFVEKPLCQTGDELRQIKRRWNEHPELGLASNLVLRAAALYRWLKQQIAEGRFGEIYSFDGDYLYGRIHKITHGWRKDVKNYSVMHGGGIHLIDLMLWLTGQKPESVYGVGNRICTRQTAFRYHDFVSAVFTFPSGLVGRINANFGCVHRHQHVIRIFGTKATFILDDQGPRLMESRDPQAEVTRLDLDPLPEHKWDLIPGFVDSLQSSDERSAGADREFATFSVCLAADQALASNAPIGIEYL